jgi:hypothetical protein
MRHDGLLSDSALNLYCTIPTVYTTTPENCTFSHRIYICVSRMIFIVNTHYYCYYYYYLIIISGSAAQRGLWPPRPRGFLITHNDAPQSLGLIWTSKQLVAETST